MNKAELEEKLELLGVNKEQYSLEGNLNSDSIVLYHNYNSWEVFYFDERGNRNDQKNFQSESDACNYIYKLFKDAKDIENKFGIRT